MESLLRSAKFEVVRRQITGAGGRSHARDVVVHPGAAVILPLLDADRIVMVRNYRYTLDQRLLELPAGTLDKAGEPPIACAARELEEETGYVAARLEPLGRMATSPGIMTEIIHAFVATDLTKTVARPEATEDLLVEIVSMRQAQEWILSGEIIDAKTIVTLLSHRLRTEAGR